MAQENTNKVANVKPPSKLVGALGLSSLYGIVAGIVTIPVTLYAASRGNLKLAQASYLISGVPGLVGLVVGWKRAGRQAEHMNNLATQRDVAVGIGHGLEQRVQQLESELKQRPSFAERYAPRAEHGSHADAVLADKAQAENAERVH